MNNERHYLTPLLEPQSIAIIGASETPGSIGETLVRNVLDASFPGKVFFVNPGSVGQPRDGDPRASFGVFDTAKREFQLVRVAYPIKQAADRVVEAGLPPFLAERLSLGR